MLTAITYNVTPDSLDAITPEAFVDAFENEVYAKPRYRNLTVKVTFDPGKSGITSITVDDDNYPDPSWYNDEFAYLGERAFRACCADK